MNKTLYTENIMEHKLHLFFVEIYQTLIYFDLLSYKIYFLCKFKWIYIYSNDLV